MVPSLIVAGGLFFLGRADPRILAALERRGWRIHRVGQAAYVHHGGFHLILGVWQRRSGRPSWADRLGRPSAGFERRVVRCVHEQRWRQQLRRDDGRFGGRRPWWRWPSPAVYSFLPSIDSDYPQ